MHFQQSKTKSSVRLDKPLALWSLNNNSRDLCTIYVGYVQPYSNKTMHRYFTGISFMKHEVNESSKTIGNSSLRVKNQAKP